MCLDRPPRAHGYDPPVAHRDRLGTRRGILDGQDRPAAIDRVRDLLRGGVARGGEDRRHGGCGECETLHRDRLPL
jgi:hypothetical protein